MPKGFEKKSIFFQATLASTPTSPSPVVFGTNR